jgi:transcriptional regulator with XRE-family HTH domain
LDGFYHIDAGIELCGMKPKEIVMQEEMKQIAERLKGLRDAFNTGAETLAKAVEIPIETYKQYEAGKADIPVGALYRIAGYFKVELSSILTGVDPKLHHYCLVRKDGGVSVDRRTDYRYQNLAFNFAHKKAEPFLVTVEPSDDKKTVPVNAHPGQEFDYCLEGAMEISINGHAVTLGEGDSVFFDSSLPHGMKALAGKRARFLAMIM